MSNADLAQHLWRFVRGDIAILDFEQWVYVTPELEALLGQDRHLELISADYSSSDAQRRLQKQICMWLDPSGESCCSCLDWNDREKIPLDSGTSRLLDGFDALQKRNPWLKLVRCRRCGRCWYVAIDTIDDDYYFCRVSAQQAADAIEHDRWPPDFDEFAHVWPLSSEGPPATVHYPWK
jgi:hypothetical protein